MEHTLRTLRPAGEYPPQGEQCVERRGEETSYIALGQLGGLPLAKPVNAVTLSGLWGCEPGRCPQPISACDPYREAIEFRLSRGVTLGPSA